MYLRVYRVITLVYTTKLANEGRETTTEKWWGKREKGNMMHLQKAIFYVWKAGVERRQRPDLARTRRME